MSLNGRTFIEDQEQVESQQPICPICLADLSEEAKLVPCLHSFCEPCISEWSARKRLCPVCKGEFESLICEIKADDDYVYRRLSPLVAQVTASIQAPTSSSYGEHLEGWERLRWRQLLAGNTTVLGHPHDHRQHRHQRGAHRHGHGVQLTNGAHLIHGAQAEGHLVVRRGSNQPRGEHESTGPNPRPGPRPYYFRLLRTLSSARPAGACVPAVLSASMTSALQHASSLRPLLGMLPAPPENAFSDFALVEADGPDARAHEHAYPAQGPLREQRRFPGAPHRGGLTLPPGRCAEGRSAEGRCVEACGLALSTSGDRRGDSAGVGVHARGVSGAASVSGTQGGGVEDAVLLHWRRSVYDKGRWVLPLPPRLTSQPETLPSGCSDRSARACAKVSEWVTRELRALLREDDPLLLANHVLAIWQAFVNRGHQHSRSYDASTSGTSGTSSSTKSSIRATREAAGKAALGRNIEHPRGLELGSVQIPPRGKDSGSSGLGESSGLAAACTPVRAVQPSEACEFQSAVTAAAAAVLWGAADLGSRGGGSSVASSSHPPVTSASAAQAAVALLEPFLLGRARQFWHELCCFGASHFTLATYDRVVKYSQGPCTRCSECHCASPQAPEVAPGQRHVPLTGTQTLPTWPQWGMAGLANYPVPALAPDHPSHPAPVAAIDMDILASSGRLVLAAGVSGLSLPTVGAAARIPPMGSSRLTHGPRHRNWCPGPGGNAADGNAVTGTTGDRNTHGERGIDEAAAASSRAAGARAVTDVSSYCAAPGSADRPLVIKDDGGGDAHPGGTGSGRLASGHFGRRLNGSVSTDARHAGDGAVSGASCHARVPFDGAASTVPDAARDASGACAHDDVALGRGQPAAKRRRMRRWDVEGSPLTIASTDGPRVAVSTQHSGAAGSTTASCGLMEIARDHPGGMLGGGRGEALLAANGGQRPSRGKRRFEEFTGGFGADQARCDGSVGRQHLPPPDRRSAGCFALDDSTRRDGAGHKERAPAVPSQATTASWSPDGCPCEGFRTSCDVGMAELPHVNLAGASLGGVSLLGGKVNQGVQAALEAARQCLMRHQQKLLNTCA
eukprot:jgi/Mesvir1/24185/Mv10902-RA.1